jgi:predicted lipid carrier protein YhbT
VRSVPAESLGGNLGECCYRTARLSVATRQTPFNTKDTLLHEVLHATLASAMWERTAEEEERYVNTISTGLTAVLRDNPEFVQWLTEPFPHDLPT